MVDALPYFDHMTPEMKRQVDAMIDEELRRSTKRPADYLREMPPMPPSRLLEGGVHPMLAADMKRVESKEAMPPLSSSRYLLEPPPAARRHDLGAWRASVDNAHSQLEHQYLRITNLELMLKFGDKNWRAQGQLDEAAVKQYEVALEETKKAITAVNMERKLQQTAAGSELRRAEAEYYQLLIKNSEIEVACDKLESELQALAAAADVASSTPVEPSASLTDGPMQPAGEAEEHANGGGAGGAAPME